MVYVEQEIAISCFSKRKTHRVYFKNKSFHNKNVHHNCGQTFIFFCVPKKCFNCFNLKMLCSSSFPVET